MSRLSDMDRFEGPDEVEPKVVGKCKGRLCNLPIYEGESHIVQDNKRYCGLSCMVSVIDFDWVTEGDDF